LRYYDIAISQPGPGGLTYQTGNGLGFTLGNGGTTFTSLLPNGQTNPNALQVEFDFPVSNVHQPTGQFFARIWGVGLPMIGQASQLAGMDIVIRAGMKKGLPLANPDQSGIILEGSIFQSYGNWIGAEQHIDLVFNSNESVPDVKFSSYWNPGTPAIDFITRTLNASFPGFAVVPNIIATLTPPSSAFFFYQDFTAFAQWVEEYTQKIGAQWSGNPLYPGVRMRLRSSSKKIYVFDNPDQNHNIAFQDLIGQPTWIGPNQMNFKTVLRADIDVGNSITFPQGVQQPFAITATQTSPGAPASSKTVFQGMFEVNKIHHFANFRQPDSMSWNTTFDVSAIPKIKKTLGPP